MTLSILVREVAAILAFVAQAFLHLLPWLAVSVALAVWLRRAGLSRKVETHLGRRPLVAILLATLFGAVSPFCSCGVIPVVSALLLGGVPLAPVMAFWLASPSMDPEIFFLSVGALGWELAVWRLAGTFAMSLGGGLLVHVLERRGWLGRDALDRLLLGARDLLAPPTTGPVLATACCGGTPPPLEAPLVPACACQAGHCEPEVTAPAGSSTPAGCANPGTSLLRETLSTSLALSGYMLVAFVLEAVITRYVPQELIAGHLGTASPWAVPLATLVSIPMYTTNFSALGLVAGLRAQGMSGGAALAFLIGGAVTTLPAMSAVFGIVKRKVFLLYLGVSVAGSLLTGLLYQALHAGAR